MKGFDAAWKKQVVSYVQAGSIGIQVNDDIGHYFQTQKGLRERDPMSPILFNVVVDMLAVLIGRAKEDGKVGGLIPHLVDGGVSILQYADDTIIFMKHDLAKARNMKLVLCLFEQLSGLKINFNKVSCSALDAPRKNRKTIDSCSVVSWDLYHLDIWEYQFIVVD